MPANLPDPRLLKVDKTSVTLKSSTPSDDQVTILNPTPWAVTLQVNDPKIPGLSVKLSNVSIMSHGKVTLKLHTGNDLKVPQRPVTIIVTVVQTKQTFPIKLSFAD